MPGRKDGVKTISVCSAMERVKALPPFSWMWFYSLHWTARW